MATGRNSDLIKQRIALDGGAAFKAELEALGKVGEEAFRKLQAAAGTLTFGNKVLGEVTKIRDQFARFSSAAGAVRGSLNNVGDSFDGMAKRVGVATGALALATAGVVSLVRSAVDAGGKINDGAQKIGLSNDAYQKFTLAAKQAGLEAGSFESAIAKLSKGLVESKDLGTQLASGLAPIQGAAERAKSGLEAFGVTVTRGGQAAKDVGEKTADAADVLASFGIAARDANGNIRPTGDLLLELADAFEKNKDGPAKTAAAMTLFGKAGKELIPFLNQGSAAIQTVFKRFQDLGILLSDLEIKTLDDLGDEFDTFNATIAGTKNRLVALFAPALVSGFKFLEDAIAANRKEIESFAIELRDGVVQTVKDFYNALAGNRQDVQSERILRFVDAVRGLQKAFSEAIDGTIIPAFAKLRRGLDATAAAFTRFTGIKLDGDQLGLLLIVGQLLGINRAIFATIGLFTNLGLLLVQTLGLFGTVIRGTVGIALAGLARIGLAVTALTGRFPLLGLALRAAFLGAFAFILADAVANFDKIKAFFAEAASNIAKIFEGDLIGGLTGLFGQITSIAATTWLEIVAGAVLAAKGVRLAFSALGAAAGGLKGGLLTGLLGGSAEVAAAEAAAATAGAAAGASFGTSFARAALLAGSAVTALGTLGALVISGKAKEIEDGAREAIRNAQAAADVLNTVDSQRNLRDDAQAILRASEAVSDLDQRVAAELAKGTQNLEPPDLTEYKAAVTEATDFTERAFESSVGKVGGTLADLSDRARRALSFEPPEIPAPATTAFENALTDLSDRARNGFSNIAAGAEAFGKSVEVTVNGVVQKVPQVAEAAGAAIEAVGKQIDILVNGKLVRVPEAIEASLGGAGQAARLFGQEVQNAASVAGSSLDALQDQLEALRIDLAVANAGGGTFTPSPSAPGFDTSNLRPSTNIEDRRGDPSGVQRALDDVQPAIEQTQQAAVTAFAAIVTAAQSIPDQIAGVWQTIATQATTAFAGLGPLIASAISGSLDAVRALVQGIGRDLTAGITTAMQGVEAAVSSTIASINSQLAALEAQIARVIAAAQAAQSAAASAASSSAPGFASGGYIRGPGTTRSDSIPAWLSDREFVQQAKAVAYYGVDVMHALNSMKLPADLLRRLLRGGKEPAFRNGGPVSAPRFTIPAPSFRFSIPAPSFNVGGLVEAVRGSLAASMAIAVPAPAFAGGGPVAAPQRAGAVDTVRLQYVDATGRVAAEIDGPRETIDKIVKFSKRLSVRSAGRKPSWNGS